MTAAPPRIAFVVPTKDRPHELRRMLKSLQAQSIRADQIIIVDGSDRPIDALAREFGDLNVEYVRHRPPSLAAQRNAGMARLRPDVTLAGYLDDDLVLLDGALEAMMAFWQKAPSTVGGARFNIMDEPRRVGWKILVPLAFRLTSWRPGRILKSGFESPIGTVDADLRTMWLSGGATMWRREVVARHRFDAWFKGTGHLEDIDYSFRVGRTHTLWVVAGARVLHLSPPVRDDRYWNRSYQGIVNRWYFIGRHKELSRALFVWGALGIAFVEGLRLLLKRDRRIWDGFRGHLAGLVDLVRGRARQDSTILK